MVRLLLLCICFQCCVFSVKAQEEFIDPPSKPLVTIPFIQFTGGVIVFRALLDDFKDSLTFILDTGSGGISLDSTTVKTLGLEPGPPERIIRGIGGVRKVGFLKNRVLQVGDYKIDSLNFHVIDYEVLTSLYGQKIDGIIGYSVLSRYILKINYEKQEISFCTPGIIKYPKGGYLMRPYIRMLPYSRATIDDNRKRGFNYLFDLGAGLTVLFSDDFMNDSSFLKTKRRRFLKQGEGLGGRVDMYLTVMKSLRVGPYKFRNVPVNIFSDEYNVTSYPSLGGLIGNEIFRRFNVILNYDKQQIHLTPNRFFYTPFDYAYSGIELYLVNGAAVTGKIPPGSPAEKAGLREGDEILAINNRFGLQLDDLKQALQSTYGKVKIIYKRNGELSSTVMNVINITRK
ncbi:aspartyl protease family protein [Niabella beijingensis]|uniref:aspartyl protease family protein n=1 Tax=Niabella beijingensis TaxID=2872700 RepID=UPI001CC0F899|nr:aspartyl protease family protein [Niabella beijingensis]MBZ4189631.1 aspartyl protease family protein [Niabella beijingensis]